MVASHMEMMNMILKGFMAAAVIYSKPLRSLFFFEPWNMEYAVSPALLCEISSRPVLFPQFSSSKYILSKTRMKIIYIL